MLDTDTKRRIDTCRDILVGKVPDPKSQVEQITIALIYKFMDDMDAEAEELGGSRSFFTGEFARYGWSKMMAPGLGGHEMLSLYAEAIQRMNENPGIPPLFREIFKNAFLPYRDPETLRSFLKEINTFTYDHSERLGDAFEYLLSVLGSQGEAGQFRTPRHIIDFMVEITDPKKDETILDPACGTAGFLISAYKHILKRNSTGYQAQQGREAYDEQDVPMEALTLESPLRYSGDRLTPDDRRRLATSIGGYDISPDMVRLSLVNMYLHGFIDPHIEEYDTLTSDEKWTELADVILANPPFMSPKGGIRPHNRFSVQSKRSEVLFVDYIAEHLTPNGRAAVVVPEGIIFQSQGAYKQLREMLVKNYLVAVVSLPAGVFNPYSGVKTSILVLDKRLAKQRDEVLFVKIDNDGFNLGAQRRPIDKNDLPEAVRTVKAFLQQGEVAERRNVLAASRERIGENGEWSLSGERYAIEKPRDHAYGLVALEDVVEILDSQRKPITKHDRKPGPYPYYGATGVLDYVDGYLFDEPLVLVGEDGAKWDAGERTAYQIFGKTWVNNHAHVLRPNRERILDVLLVELLCGMDLSPYITGVTVPKLNQQKLRSIKFPLPPLEVQKEIVAEIEGYQKIIDGARQVVENYQPRIRIHPDWPLRRVQEVCQVNPKKVEVRDLPGDLDVSFVPMADVSENEMLFSPKETKKLEEVIKGYTYFRENDVLLAKVTPCFENGKAGIARNLINGIGFGSSEFYVIRASDLVLPEWIYMAVTTNTFRESSSAQMTGTGGLQRVPRAVVEEHNIPVPGVEIQQAIVDEVEAELRVVEANKELIHRFEEKIKQTIKRVWGEAE